MLLNSIARVTKNNMVPKICFFSTDKKALFKLLEFLDNNVNTSSEIHILSPFELGQSKNRMYQLIQYQTLWSMTDIERVSNILMMRAVFLRFNRALNLIARIKILGNERNIISTKSFKRLVSFIKYNSIFSLIKIYWLRNKSPEYLVNKFRPRVSDIDAIYGILSRQNFQKLIVISTFKNPIIYDFLNAAELINKRVEIIVDSWDNIGTSFAIPETISKLWVWSQQQFEEVNLFFNNLSSKTEIIGNFRIDKALNFQKVERGKLSGGGRLLVGQLNITYLQAYYYDNTISHLTLISEEILKLIVGHDKITKINLIIRPYPHKSHGSKRVNIDKIVSELKNNYQAHNLNIEVSKEIDLFDDLINTDLVFSEITSAGLESLFSGKPTVFLYGSSKLLYPNGTNLLIFKFVQDLLDFNLLYPGNRTSIRSRLSDFIFLKNQYMYYDESRHRYFGEKFQISNLISL
jgi:hypothetical protein